MNDTEHIAAVKRNIEIRQAAELAFELVLTVAEENGCRGSRKFWEPVYVKVQNRLPKPEVKVKGKPSKKMTDEESKRFGKELIPFGEFQGKSIDEVPLDRLWWYADQTFVDDLRRYLQSDRIQSEVRE